MKKRNLLLIACALVVLVTGAALLGGCGKKDAKSEAKYPTKPINMIIAFTAGGSSDVQARIVDKYWKEEFGQNLVITYKTGAGGQVGFTELAKSAPDGYTIGGINVPHIVLQALSPQATFSKDDFIYLCQVVNDPQVIAVRKESEIKTLKQLIDTAKAKDGKMTMGIVGTFTGHHVAALKFMDLTGTKFSLVPFQGAADQNIALMGGHVDVMVGNLNAIMRDLGKDVPTFKEQGLNFVSDIRGAFAVPKNTDPAIVARLRAGFDKICAKKEYLADMEKIGQPSEYMTGEEFKKYVDGYHAEAKALLEKYGLIKK